MNNGDFDLFGIFEGFFFGNWLQCNLEFLWILAEFSAGFRTVIFFLNRSRG